MLEMVVFGVFDGGVNRVKAPQISIFTNMGLVVDNMALYHWLFLLQLFGHKLNFEPIFGHQGVRIGSRPNTKVVDNWITFLMTQTGIHLGII